MSVEKIFQQVMNENCKNPLYRFAELVRQDEREACAKLCEEQYEYYGCDHIFAAKIRGRTEKEAILKEISDIGQALDGLAETSREIDT
jgi:hypothetical protein